MSFEEWFNQIDELIKTGIENDYIIYTEDLEVVQGLYESTMFNNVALLDSDNIK